MDSAGTRPSERPLAARSESNMTTGSTSSFSKYNSYASANSMPQAYPGQTPQVSQDSLENTFAAPGNSEPSRSEIFGSGPIRVEPEALETFADNQTKTPTPVSSARMSSSSSVVINSPTSPWHPPSWPHPSTKLTDQQPKPTPPPSITAASHCSQPTNSSSSNSKQASLSDAEKRQRQLQLRVYRARTQMPSHIPLRVFREPAECVEAQEVLNLNT